MISMCSVFAHSLTAVTVDKAGYRCHHHPLVEELCDFWCRTLYQALPNRCQRSKPNPLRRLTTPLALWLMFHGLELEVEEEKEEEGCERHGKK